MRSRSVVTCVFTVLAGLAGCSRNPMPDLVTVAERSGFVRTGRFDEVQRLCADFQSAPRQRPVRRIRTLA